MLADAASKVDGEGVGEGLCVVGGKGICVGLSVSVAVTALQEVLLGLLSVEGGHGKHATEPLLA